MQKKIVIGIMFVLALVFGSICSANSQAMLIPGYYGNAVQNYADLTSAVYKPSSNYESIIAVRVFSVRRQYRSAPDKDVHKHYEEGVWLFKESGGNVSTQGLNNDWNKINEYGVEDFRRALIYNASKNYVKLLHENMKKFAIKKLHVLEGKWYDSNNNLILTIGKGQINGCLVLEGRQVTKTDVIFKIKERAGLRDLTLIFPNSDTDEQGTIFYGEIKLSRR